MTHVYMESCGYVIAGNTTAPKPGSLETVAEDTCTSIRNVDYKSLIRKLSRPYAKVAA